MNILFVSAILPYPLFSGGQVRVYNLLKRLSQKHTIYLYSFIRSTEEKKYLGELSFCKDVRVVYRGHAWQPHYVLKSVLGSYPFVMSTYSISRMNKEISSLLEKTSIDIIHIEPGYVWPSIPNTTLPIVVSEHNIEHKVYEGYVNQFHYPLVTKLMKKDVRKLETWEKTIWNSAACVVAVSDEDASEVKQITKKPVRIIPNGIDPDTFHFNPKRNITSTFTCLFVGNFRWIQNIDALRYLLANIWPMILLEYPDAKLRIVGREFPKNLRSLLTASTSVENFVEDISDEFEKADIVLAPIRVGGGTKYKILEAMACGVPVITTQKGTQGLPVEHLRHCYISESETDWNKNIKLILSHPDENYKIVNQARQLVELKYSWNTIAKELSDVWKDVLHGK